MTRRLYRLGLIALQCGLMSLLAKPALAHENVPTATPFAYAGGSSQVSNQADDSLLVFNASSSFEGQGRPHSRTSGGSRGTCGEQLVALLPGSGTVSPSAAASTSGADAHCSLPSASDLATTLNPQPTLWFHIPAQEQAGAIAELALLDDQYRAIAIETIILPAESGIMGVQLSHPLEVGQPYQWVFSILEYPNQPSNNPTVEGRLQHVEPDSALTTALNAAQTPQDRIHALAQHGIWHTALDELADLYRSEPDNPEVTHDWLSLLSSVGLANLAEEQLLNCCGTHE